MKKNQSKSKFEERKSVANQCDYCRANGKCGRAMSNNFNTPCPGRTCEDWKCDAEGEDPCIHLGGEDYCADFKADKITCDNCPKWVSACPELRAGSSAVAVVEPTGAVVPSDQDAVALFREQMGRIKAAEGNLQFERIKFGVILLRWEAFLGTSNAGRGSKGHGLKGWLETNLKELPYETAHGYKQQALQAVRYVQGENAAEIPVQVAQAALLGEEKVEQPDGKVIDVPSEVIEAKNDLMENATSRRKLVQMYFNALKPEFQGKPGRKAGSSAGAGGGGTGTVKTRTLLEMALLYAEPICTALKKSVTHSTVKDLQGWDRSLLEEYVANVEQYLKELKEVLKQR